VSNLIVLPRTLTAATLLLLLLLLVVGGPGRLRLLIIAQVLLPLPPQLLCTEHAAW
jgi:hypothetical protein